MRTGVIIYNSTCTFSNAKKKKNKTNKRRNVQVMFNNGSTEMKNIYSVNGAGITMKLL